MDMVQVVFVNDVDSYDGRFVLGIMLGEMQYPRVLTLTGCKAVIVDMVNLQEVEEVPTDMLELLESINSISYLHKTLTMIRKDHRIYESAPGVLELGRHSDTEMYFITEANPHIKFIIILY